MPIARELTDEVLISHAHELRRRAIQGDMQARELAHEYEIELRIRLRQRTAEASENGNASPTHRSAPQSRVADNFSAPTSAAARSDDLSIEMVNALLRNARELLEMDIVLTSEHSQDRIASAQIAGKAGTLVPTRLDSPESCQDSATRMPEISLFLSAPVILPNGEIYGTLCCVSHRPRSALGNRQVDALRTVAALVSTEIDKIRRTSAV